MASDDRSCAVATMRWGTLAVRGHADRPAGAHTGVGELSHGVVDQVDRLLA